MEINFKVTNVYKKNEKQYLSDKRFIINSGGTRSSKTYSILQLFVIILMQNKNYKISCYRNLRIDCIDTCGQDFANIIRECGLISLFTHNVKDAKWVCKSTGSTIYFAGTEKIHKALGQQNNIIFLNEISEFSQDVFNQLNQRTRDKVFIDYNPSKDFWIEKYRENSAAVFLHSTYRDNPFITDGQRATIDCYNPYEEGSTYVENSTLMYEGYPVSIKNQPPPNVENIKTGLADKYMYEVYNLGLGSEKPNRIYTTWKECDDEFFQALEFERYYGLDFGVTSPTAVVEVCFDGDRTFYLNEILYKPSSEMGIPLAEYLTQPRGAENKPIIPPDIITVCDSAKKDAVLDLRNGGITAVSALKGRGSVFRTIMVIKSFNIVYTKSSSNIREEQLEYSWKKDRYGLAEEIPGPRQDDHLMDATGYIISWLVNYLGIGSK